MEKYITIPAEELKGREKRAFPNGKKVLSPEWVEQNEKDTAFPRKLLAGGGKLWEKNGKRRIYFNMMSVGNDFVDVYYDLAAEEWSDPAHGEIAVAQIENGTIIGA